MLRVKSETVLACFVNYLHPIVKHCGEYTDAVKHSYQCASFTKNKTVLPIPEVFRAFINSKMKKIFFDWLTYCQPFSHLFRNNPLIS